jgi:hypothetical protein
MRDAATRAMRLHRVSEELRQGLLQIEVGHDISFGKSIVPQTAGWLGDGSLF